MSTESKFRIREAKTNERDTILTLLNDLFVPQQRSCNVRGVEYFDWKFLRSPYGKSILTVVEYNDQVVGFDHLWPWQLNYRDSTYLAYQGCDTAVKKEFRGNSLMLQMRSFGVNEVKSRGGELLFNFPNEQSLKTNLNYGYNYLGKIKWWVKVINLANLLALFVGNNSKRSFQLPPDSCLLTDANLVVSLYKNYHFKELISINRTVEFVAYRYINHPFRKYYIEDFKGEICAIYTINNRNGIGEMVITDIIGEKRLIYKLLLSITQIAKELRCAYLTVVADNQLLDHSLLKIGFLPKKLKNLVVFPINQQLEFARTYSAWNLSASLHDSI